MSMKCMGVNTQYSSKGWITRTGLVMDPGLAGISAYLRVLEGGLLEPCIPWKFFRGIWSNGTLEGRGGG